MPEPAHAAVSSMESSMFISIFKLLYRVPMRLPMSPAVKCFIPPAGAVSTLIIKAACTGIATFALILARVSCFMLVTAKAAPVARRRTTSITFRS
jgi:hypothetical protein